MTFEIIENIYLICETIKRCTIKYPDLKMVGIGGNTEGEGRGIPTWKDWKILAPNLK